MGRDFVAVLKELKYLAFVALHSIGRSEGLVQHCHRSMHLHINVHFIRVSNNGRYSRFLVIVFVYLGSFSDLGCFMETMVDFSRIIFHFENVGRRWSTMAAE
jgi:hypothetical protein